MYKAIVNNENNFQISHSGQEIKVNEVLFEWDLQQIGDRKYHIIRNGKSYRLEVVSIIREEKKFILKINGRKQEVQLKDRYDLLLEKLGMSELASQQLTQVKAPMPGLILEIKVAEGSEVKKGEAIMILEAMKMENVLKSPGEGVVKSIKVKKGESVEKNQVLIQF